MPPGISPDRLARIQADFMGECQALFDQARQGALAPPDDRRFSSPAWADSPQGLFAAHAYLIGARALRRLAESADLGDDARQRLQFAVMQWIEAASPANFLATNPEALATAWRTQGESLLKGMSNLLGDMQKGHISQTDESAFVLGENIAASPGAVVFQNALMQVIQYRPLARQVHARPLLMVPPCINKFYILDLQADNSFVRHALEAGYAVYMISWRNPLASDTDGIERAGWDDYMQDGVLQAIEVVRDISGQDQINALGFCVGGTMLASALALAQARGEDPVAALTLLTTFLDFRDTGILDVFVDECHARSREQQFGDGGLMTARELGTTFSFLRPSELVWNYVASNYMMGQTPRAFDLLAWNADGTNLPGPFFAWYFRNTYLENRLKTPGAVQVCGQSIDLGALRMPAYLYASREDHIVPWASAYASRGVLGGDTRFVLGESGHIAGVINPPARGRRGYWAYDEGDRRDAAVDAQAWQRDAPRHAGSWWPDWLRWLSGHSGRKVRAKDTLGNRRYRTLEPAPGHYVRVRAE
ncbi:PHA/PHB synthase family protein [Castellaniella sp. S9]|uniref:PHA/PHB synthase family protein n=1 Tax=Castellaniella sp. S9 TaxID=2993652 RepID=UPI0022B52389|nr:class I poly(R)-hydroxyalkanoic acid synthase [Castellaniella sp. S9]